MLPIDIFKVVVQNTPLIAIDLIVCNSENKILLGKRVSQPAKGFMVCSRGTNF